MPTQNGHAHLREWDHGVFKSEILKNDIFPRKLAATDNDLTTPAENIGDSLKEGTFAGTERAATEMHHRIQQRFASFFDIAGFESTIPIPRTLARKQEIFTFTKPGSDNYPPHLDMVPTPVGAAVDFLSIFNFMRLLDTGLLLPRVIPEKILDFINDDPISGTMAGIEARNHEIRAAKKNIGNEPNIGDRSDWYTDAVFAQQFFTGPNPTTIIKAGDWRSKFESQAKSQGNQKFVDLFKTAAPDSLYVQDYSYFRDAVKASQNDILISDDGKRFGCAAVCLFQLTPAGKLHPLAIVLDYKGTMENSVTIFNRRLSPTDPSLSESQDWPWRYAKMCVQISDWTCHELNVHLTETHLVEEVVIVAAHRSFPIDHPVYRLMEPHWLKTLPLNAAARSTLVPGFIVFINGMTTPQTYSFINDAYKRYDFKGRYIPNDLANRGFAPAELDSPKFHNYVYGKNMLALWQKLKDFITEALKTTYKTDADVMNDKYLQAFVTEMRNPNGGAMANFPEIKTVAEAIDMVVMCIHIASPQHTAVNYLQDYYQAFVPNKPGALCSPLPTTLQDLNSFKEPDMVRALPTQQARVWLMTSHLPWLLSYRSPDDQTLLNYAMSLKKLAENDPKSTDPIIVAGPKFCMDLMGLKKVFDANSRMMDDQNMPYNVMDPEVTPISILL